MFSLDHKGYLKSFYDYKSIDIEPAKAKKIWKSLYDNQECINKFVEEDETVKYIGKYFEQKEVSKLTGGLEVFRFRIDGIEEIGEDQYKLILQNEAGTEIIANGIYSIQKIKNIKFIDKDE
jgi:hypothetical protein